VVVSDGYIRVYCECPVHTLQEICFAVFKAHKLMLLREIFVCLFLIIITRNRSLLLVGKRTIFKVKERYPHQCNVKCHLNCLTYELFHQHFFFRHVLSTFSLHAQPIFPIYL